MFCRSNGRSALDIEMLLGFEVLECYVDITAMWVFSLVPALGLASHSPLLPHSGYAAWLAYTHRMSVCSSLAPGAGTSGRTNSEYPSDHELPSAGVTSFLVMEVVPDIFIYRLRGLLR